jgi:hypothetical protein
VDCACFCHLPGTTVHTVDGPCCPCQQVGERFIRQPEVPAGQRTTPLSGGVQQGRKRAVIDG